MSRSSYMLVAVLPLAFVAACGDKTTDLFPGGGARVRFANATNTTVSVVNDGVLFTSNTGIGFGGTTSCITVDASNPSALVFTNTSTGATIVGFTPTLTPGGSFTIIAYIGATGTTQFAILNDAFTPTSGSAGVRTFNAASGSGTVTIVSNGTALPGTSATFGTASSFVSVPSGTDAITVDSGTNQIVDAGSLTFNSGQTSTLIVGPAAAGTTTLRSFTTNGC